MIELWTEDEYVDMATAVSPRWRSMLVLLARGMTPQDAAQVLCISPAFFYAELRRIRDVLGVNTNAAAVVVALAVGLVELPEVGEMVWA